MGTINTLSSNPAAIKPWTPPADMYRQLLVRAAVGCFATRNAQPYAAAFNTSVQQLGSIAAVKNGQQVPEPWFFAEAVKATDALFSGLDYNLDTSEVLRGLFLLEYFMEHPEEKANFTPGYYSDVARRIAGL